MTIDHLEITALYHYYPPYQKFSNELPLINYMSILHLTNGLLYESQYGFRKLHSTELAALEFTDRISQEMDAKKIPFSIFLDLSKAFDTLYHKVLLTKLHYYGIRDIALYWFRSCLTKRTQYVDCNRKGCASRLYPRPTFIHNLYERHTHSE